METVVASAGTEVTLRSDRFIALDAFYADRPIPFRFIPPEEPLLSARERVARADAEVFARSAESFALQAHHVEGVSAVIADSASEVVYAMARDQDMARELRLQAIFMDVAETLGDLVVLVEGEDERPDGVLLG